MPRATKSPNEHLHCWCSRHGTGSLASQSTPLQPSGLLFSLTPITMMATNDFVQGPGLPKWRAISRLARLSSPCTAFSLSWHHNIDQPGSCWMEGSSVGTNCGSRTPYQSKYLRPTGYKICMNWRAVRTIFILVPFLCLARIKPGAAKCHHNSVFLVDLVEIAVEI